MFKNIIIGVLVVALAGMTGLALRNSRPLVCDNVTRYEDGSVVCEVFIRPSAADEVLNKQQATQEQRI